eukprot:CAMPEP_0194300868 /NCGR_PEP_ID=MMETSP0169-20130528/61492_1 /TAXON_ID=218684 /ORGANISM="Corethron pennatum, Strain L29A3" /LENGTH=484 /DNA_ID=CAMNT_0039051081 /DNA_START=328 /DNA_END=1782 /DNA_ORIENTATION=-
MSAWGKQGSARSCATIISRVRTNDPALVHLTILPVKNFGDQEALMLAEALRGNTILEEFNCSGHVIGIPALRSLGEGVGRSNLSRISVGHDNLGDAGVEAFADGLLAADTDIGISLSYVDLSLKRMSSKGLVAVGRTFSKSQKLHTLDISRNETLSDESFVMLKNMIFDVVCQPTESNIPFPALCELNLASTNIGPCGIEELSRILSHGQSSNKNQRQKLKLNLSNNPSIGDLGASAISRCLLQSINDKFFLKSLDLSNCNICDDGAKALAASICNNTCLEFLDLSNNKIGKSGAIAIGDSLKQNRKIAEARFAKNNFGEGGVFAIASSLLQCNNIDDVESTENDVITVLDMARTGGGKAGAEQLLKCCALKNLRLFDNALGSDGIAVIAPLVAHHPSLQDLDLGGNLATDEGIASFLDSLHHNNTLEVLGIGGNIIGEKATEALKRLSQARPSLYVARDKPKVKENEQNNSLSELKENEEVLG